MDGLFACPECGSDVEVGSLAPGRQVRCEFCHRLLEVPYLPRVAEGSWKRRRFARPKWVAWAWVGLGALLVVVLAAGSFRFLRRQYDSIQDRSINHLLESSQRQESEGRLGEALVDLDAALDLAEKAGPAWEKRIARDRSRRPDLARRDAEAILEVLSRSNQSSTFRVGDWLNLIARAERDPDLGPLAGQISEHFQTALSEQIKRELASGRQLFASGNVSGSMDACDRAGALIGRLSKAAGPGFHEEAEKLATELASTAGITVTVPPGRFIFGSNSYVSDMVPVLEKALEAKGYLPRRESSVWRDVWRHCPFQARLDVNEIQEGNYLSSENRLTLIHAELMLTQGDRLVWQTTPRARSGVPLPGLPAYLASRVAVSPERSDEFERLLYKNARDQIDQKFRMALANMPPCSNRAGSQRP
jgi:hypothetical protein